ncbi:hypothetical protein KY290_003080 [Solanum tuberosum]|uniref:Uncharacterized protein n=1 Tax=Solanum tuberosum TaxID=4113 RepID=A0ABQ7WU37_SOLTU|nr:hypothetical protein KY285_003048 [Solanum tuberosum]KAH0783482.1 hypothetical protein KY290_003080 [Solanum tuberosum]
MLKGETISSSIYRIYIAFSLTWQQVAVSLCQSKVVVKLNLTFQKAFVERSQGRNEGASQALGRCIMS